LIYRRAASRGTVSKTIGDQISVTHPGSPLRRNPSIYWSGEERDRGSFGGAAKSATYQFFERSVLERERATADELEQTRRKQISRPYPAGRDTLVTEDTAKALGLVGVAETVTVKGIGSIHCTPTLAKRVRFRLSPVKTNQHDLSGELIEALTLPRICGDIQSVPIRSGDWKHLQHLQITEEQD
ncbi:hypothetical protein T11_2492, partial [Trichinella zimbabwensis]